MNYTVEWDDEAADQLADVWMVAPDPTAVTRAQAEIDRLLRRNPQGNGQHLSEGIWRIQVPPLVVLYTIDEGRRHVQVRAVHATP